MTYFFVSQIVQKKLPVSEHHLFIYKINFKMIYLQIKNDGLSKSSKTFNFH